MALQIWAKRKDIMHVTVRHDNRHAAGYDLLTVIILSIP